MKINDRLFSSFIVSVDDFTANEIDDLLRYTDSKENTDLWSIELCHAVVNGHCLNNDTGLFYLYLVKKNLENKVEIIRG